MGYPVAYWFEVNESGARLHRPELFRLLDIAMAGDIILVEQVDRIRRLNTKDWEQLRNIIASKGLKVAALGLPTSHQFMHTTDEFTCGQKRLLRPATTSSARRAKSKARRKRQGAPS